jgi:hypothetical protein
MFSSDDEDELESEKCLTSRVRSHLIGLDASRKWTCACGQGTSEGRLKSAEVEVRFMP